MKVDTVIISAMLMNNGPTVPRMNRLKRIKGIASGAALRPQKRIGCVSGENVTASGGTGCPVTSLANESRRSASAFDSIGPTSAKESAGVPANCRSTPVAGSMPAYPRMRSARKRRSGPQNRASANRVVKDHDQNTPI